MSRLKSTGAGHPTNGLWACWLVNDDKAGISLLKRSLILKEANLGFSHGYLRTAKV